MSARIWKWTLPIADRQSLMLPLGAKFLTAQMQGGMPQLWALCDDTQTEKSSRVIAIYGTGHPLPDAPGEYIGTVQMVGGSLVWHIFEVTP